MATLKVDLRACDVGGAGASPDAVTRFVVAQTAGGWDQGSDVVVFPEYFWMSLEPFVPAPDKVRGVARLFWDEVWPRLRLELGREGRAVVLGTAPFEMPDGSLRNRAPILCDGRDLFQDKIHLTPWETVFSPGELVQLWDLKGARFAVLVCLDIEVPELAAALRGRGVDAILVPSATESVNGLERIGRCASARAVELCCYVGVAHLTGGMDSELVDRNMGRAAWFAPSQQEFDGTGAVLSTPARWAGHDRQIGEMDLPRLGATRRNRAETNPGLLTPKAVVVRESAD